MTHTLDPKEAKERKLREGLARRVGRQVEGVASVRPATGEGWISWFAMGDLSSPVTSAVAVTATLSAHERRRAKAMGVATRMVLAVTEHEAHLFRTRAIGRIIGDHVMAVPYGMVTKVKVGKKWVRGSAGKGHDRTHGRLKAQAQRQRREPLGFRTVSGQSGSGPSRDGRAGPSSPTRMVLLHFHASRRTPKARYAG
jgi:hypothetical protein